MLNWDKIILIGFMGTGKTTIGSLLAKELHVPFADTDQVIETRLGTTITDIFAKQGECFFRSQENSVIQELLASNSIVMATGGGAITNLHTYMFMKQQGIVIYLQASIDVLWERLQDCESRPMLKSQYPKEQMLNLYRIRQPLYQQAHYSIQVDDKTPFEITSEIYNLIKKMGNK